MGSHCCMVCGAVPVTDLYICDRGWYLATCDDPMCSVTYQWVMSYEDFIACRRMLADQRREMTGGDDRFSPGDAVTPRWDPNR